MNEDITVGGASGGENAEDEFIRSVREQGEKVKELYPDFDIVQEMKNPLFAIMLASGESVLRAAEFFHPEIAQKRMEAELEREILERIRARNSRPVTLGATGAGTVQRTLSNRQVMEIDRRIKRGERVVL